MIRLFKSKLLISQLHPEELEQLLYDFKAYKSKQYLPSSFGRDVAYDSELNFSIIKNEEIRHMHLLDCENSKHLENKNQFHKTSDIHLIYCQSFKDPNIYLLMAILKPNVHAQARNNSIMNNLGKMAENFRKKY